MPNLNNARIHINKYQHDTAIINGEKITFREYENPSIDIFHQFLNGSYKIAFLKSPSTLKLFEGYIHASGLEYLMPFGESYIKK